MVKVPNSKDSANKETDLSELIDIDALMGQDEDPSKWLEDQKRLMAEFNQKVNQKEEKKENGKKKEVDKKEQNSTRIISPPIEAKGSNLHKDNSESQGKKKDEMISDMHSVCGYREMNNTQEVSFEEIRWQNYQEFHELEKKSISPEKEKN